MDKKHTSLKFKAKVTPIEKINDEFTLCKCYVQGVGKNRNFSYMSKENIQRCLPTLSYAPVVGHLIDKLDEDGNPTGEKYMGGHDYYIDDDWNLKSACVPYGVVKADSFEFETVKEYEDEIETEYLTAEVILWTGRYPELMEAIYSDDFYFNQSMEINVSEFRPYEEDSNYTELTDFTYSALCLLGKADDKTSPEHTEPCFVESKVIPVQYSLEREDFSKVMGELKNELAFYFNKDKIDGKEDEVVENEKEEVIETVEEVNEESTEEVVENTTEETPDAEVNEDTNTESENEEVQEDETVVEASVEETVEETVEMSELDSLKSEYEEYKNSHSHTNEEFDELQKYHDDAEFEKIHAERETMLSDEKYSVLAENEAFAELKKNMDNYSLADLEKEAKVIFADYVSSVGTFSMNDSNKKSTSKIRFSMKKDTGKTKAYSTLFK
ncbi:MAG: hypothetical protein MSH33_04950 [Fusobacterium necrophorum]|nr:hypothetical protein [Fusobacterium necrophorum]